MPLFYIKWSATTPWWQKGPRLVCWTPYQISMNFFEVAYLVWHLRFTRVSILHTLLIILYVTIIMYLFWFKHPAHTHLWFGRATNLYHALLSLSQCDPQATWLPIESWWRHQMETLSGLLAICAGNSPVTGAFSARRALMFSLICAWMNAWVNSRYDVTCGLMVVYYDRWKSLMGAGDT